MLKLDDIKKPARPTNEREIQQWINANVLQLLEEHQMPRTELAAAIHMSTSALSARIVRNRVWTIWDVYEVCRVFNVPLRDVLPPRTPPKENNAGR